ncbi:hypothetical protein CYLTODRAFT_430268 [Cylindrobasidium torrendii FP15055 ss-10]|uniref:Tyrosine specific protein phosphatases domain-containing protein n=1 Tax=Cylindrobasidium torrendii FP15055 ss-10 TaxID=1314674 RepID=A0A0D7BHR7_9AGAR|nr:hypothetical protein CYLTODRAFT_430268 [Cylindrobasidium torrendii FP15055 ss-10]
MAFHDDDLESLDASYVAQVLSKHPFLTIPGVINVRDLGLYQSTTHPGKVTRPLVALRSAELSAITDEGKMQLRALNVKTVFDLRSDTELEKYAAPLPIIEGVSVVRIPVFQKEDYSPEMMAKRFQLYASGKTEAFMELYTQILDNAGSSVSAVLRHIRDHPNEGCIFHCTAGKDRTGILAAIILLLCGVSDEDIAQDYALTRIGREPAREKIMKRLEQEPLFQENNSAALNMFTCRRETMLAFLGLLRAKYGGAEEYVKVYTDLTDQDIELVKTNMLVDSEPSG